MKTEVIKEKESLFSRPFYLQKGLLLIVVIILISMFTAAAAIHGTASEPPKEIDELQQLVYDHGYNYTVAENWITALSPEERQNLCGYKAPVPPAEPELLPKNVNFHSIIEIQEPEISGSPPLGQPSSYDAMALGYVTPVKNQGSCGSCWVFAATADFESDVAIGESNLLNFAEQEVGDCNIWSSGGFNFCNGGNALMTTNYFTKRGSADETCSPYAAAPQTCLNCPIQKNVDNWRMITDGNGETQINAIKNAILNYGPVYSTIFASDPAFGAYTGGVYEYWGYDDVNHAIEIIGWDDSLLHSHGSGAWMIKNSWGTGWGASGPYPGCAWVAYGSANIGDWTSGIASYKNPGDMILYHDESGWMNWCLGYLNPTAYGAVRFAPPQDSTLTAVDFWAVDASMQYEIRIFDTLNDLGGGSYSLSSQLGTSQTGTTNESGYYSIPLNTPVSITGGDDFIVQVNLTTTTGWGYPLPIDYYTVGWLPLWSSIAVFSNESYQSPDGTQFVKPAEDIGIRARLVAQQQTEGWYFKANHSNYAPSGMPDFDQKQNGWQTINAGPDGIADTITNAGSDDVQVSAAGSMPGPYKPVIAPGPDCKLDTIPAGDDSVIWSFCGPTAVANCLWWFDSKYADPNGTPGDGSDIFPLVQDYGTGDDHLAANVPPLVCDLANRMLTSSKGTTYVNDMQSAINQWLNDTGLNNRLYEHTVEKPDFYWIEEEIERSQDVILLLGFWENRGTLEYPEWVRIGGHYVTCAGVNSDAQMIAFSDPYFDNAVAGGQGRIVPDPHPLGYTYTFHNDTANISHDFYTVASSPSPGGDWGIPDYPVSLYPYLVKYFQEEEYFDGPIYTEIEYAVLISPKPCTPGIEVNKTVWNGTAWVKQINASMDDIIRFRMWVHNNGTCCDLTNITVTDTLSDSLNYSNNATVNGVSQEPLEINPDEYVWNFSGPLAPCENITIEFNASIVKCGNDTNVVNVTAWCDGTMVSDWDRADVHAPCGICGDVNNDGDVDMTDVMTLWYDIADYPYVDAYTISDAWAADVNCDGDIDMTDVMTLWYDIADYPYVDAYVVNCC